MRAHDSAIRDKLLLAQEKEDWIMLKKRHSQMISHMQHERLIHLLVTLAFGICLLITMAMALAAPANLVYLLMGLLLILFIPYVSHYFFLENMVQRWYRLSDEIDIKIRGEN
jgi:hypothetical protein